MQMTIISQSAQSLATPYERRLPELPRVSHRFLQTARLRFHLAEAGAGEPVLLLHGWLQHFYACRNVIPDLSRDSRASATQATLTRSPRLAVRCSNLFDRPSAETPARASRLIASLGSMFRSSHSFCTAAATSSSNVSVMCIRRC